LYIDKGKGKAVPAHAIKT